MTTAWIPARPPRGDAGVRRATLSVVVALTLAVPAASGQAPSPSPTPPPSGKTPRPTPLPPAAASAASPTQALTPRPELLRFAARLEERVAAVSRSAQPVVFLSGLPETRATYLPGFGAVYILAPRSLPSEASRSARVPGPRGTPAPEGAETSDGEVTLQRAPLPISTTPTSPATAPLPAASDSGVAATSAGANVPTLPERPSAIAVRVKPSDLVRLEEMIEETRRESERMRAQAEAAFAEAERQFVGGVGAAGATEPSTAAISFSGPGSAPWRFFLGENADPRNAAETERDVRDAILAGVLEENALIQGLQPADSLTISVDLVARRHPWAPAKSNRTLVVRARKADIAAAVAGQISRDELLKRIEQLVF